MSWEVTAEESVPTYVAPQQAPTGIKKLMKKWWFWAIIVVLIISIGTSGNDTDGGNASTHTTNPNQNISSNDTSSTTDNKPKEPAKTEYYVGDTIEDGNTKIVFMSSGDYVEENEFMQPADGKKYIYLHNF